MKSLYDLMADYLGKGNNELFEAFKHMQEITAKNEKLTPAQQAAGNFIAAAAIVKRGIGPEIFESGLKLAAEYMSAIISEKRDQMLENFKKENNL